MTKQTAALLLGSAFLSLLLTISYTRTWLDTMNIPTGGNCIFNAEAQKDPATRRVCLNGGCILYSDWIKMSETERIKVMKGTSKESPSSRQSLLSERSLC